MAAQLPQVIDPNAPLFTISVAANLAGMHPQTLRTYDRIGLVKPRRTSGRGRRYSPRDVAKLRLVQHLSQDEGINLNGIRRILQLEGELDLLREHVAQVEAALEAARSGQPRIFTAGASGDVHLGRHRPPQARLALPAR